MIAQSGISGAAGFSSTGGGVVTGALGSGAASGAGSCTSTVAPAAAPTA
jgi:hypothetical protein